MRGFIIDVTTPDDTTGILFNLYDNGEKVIDQIGTMNFEYLTPDPYVGEHILSLSYYREGIPEVESDQQVFYTGNFTLPILSLTFTVGLLD